MSPAELSVLVGGIAAITLVLWFFFGPRRTAAPAPAAQGPQEVTITVKGGYSPDSITVQAGRPVRLHFKRDESGGCSDQVRFPDLNLTRDLPAFQTTTVEFTPESPGTIPFTCGMSMLRGRLVVQPPARP